MILRLSARLLWVVAVILTGPAVVARASSDDFLMGVGTVLLPLAGGAGVFLFAQRRAPQPAAGRWHRALKGAGGVLSAGGLLGLFSMAGTAFSMFYVFCLGAGLSTLVVAGVASLLGRRATHRTSGVP